MYQKFFSLSELPFEGTPDRNFYYVGSNQHQTLDVLKDTLTRNGVICTLTGPSGSGKTTLVRMLIKSLPVRMRIIAIDDPRLTSSDLLSTILLSCNIFASSLESIAELTLKLRKMLESSMQSGVVTTVIIDEAQGLSDEVLEQIRLIYNIEGDFGKMLNFLLVGQEDLITTIHKDMHKMFLNRIKSFCEIPSMQKNEVQAYVNFRTMQAGCHEPLFTDKAIALLHLKSGGLPRTINIIADTALTIAFKRGKHRVDSRILKKASSISLNERGFFSDVITSIKSSFARLEFYSKLSVILFALAISFVIFSMSLYVGKHIYKSSLAYETINTALSFNTSVNEAYKEYIDNVVSGKSLKNRNIYKLNLDIWQSTFKHKAYESLLAILGYKKRGDSPLLDDDILSLGFSLITINNDLKTIIDLNTRGVIELLDDNLVPFYAVLLYVDDTKAKLLIDKHIWTVKREYLDRTYNGSFSYITDSYALNLLKSFDEALFKIHDARLHSFNNEKTLKSDLLNTKDRLYTKNIDNNLSDKIAHDKYNLILFSDFEDLLDIDKKKMPKDFKDSVLSFRHDVDRSLFYSFFKKIFVTRTEYVKAEFLRQNKRLVKDLSQDEINLRVDEHLNNYIENNILNLNDDDSVLRMFIIYYAMADDKNIESLALNLFLKEHDIMHIKEVLYAN